MLSDIECRDLAAAFTGHDYTVDAVIALIGEPAQRALGRNSTVAAVGAIGDRLDPLAVLTLLWPLQRVVARPAVESALPGLIEPLIGAGILVDRGGTVAAGVDIRPYASDDGAAGWIASDLSPNLDTASAPMRSDWVLGVSPASTTLAQLTVRRPVRRALDLGTGCGVQALHLARHAASVTATDLNPRAIELARLTTSINAVKVDLRLGSLYQPVAGERFDLITSNPPYVMSPPSRDADRLTYREGDLVGDGLVEHVVRRGVDHLAESGVLQVLGNWAHRRGQEWQERLAGWVAGTGCDAHIVQRETLDPYEYIELWLADAGLAGTDGYRDRYTVWLDYFDGLGIEAVGMGWLVLHRAGRDQPQVRIEDWPYPVEQPIGPAFAAELDAVNLVAGLSDQQILQRHWRLADVVEETSGIPGEADPQHIVLRQHRGFRRARTMDTETAAILGACDGELSLEQIIASVALLLGADLGSVRQRMLAAVDDLVVDGYLR